MTVELPILSNDETRVTALSEATILFAGDSGDGMQLAGAQFTRATARARNDLATLPDYPAEIRAPAGTTFGVSAFQIRFGAEDVQTAGDEVDMLVAMNPAALKVHGHRVRAGGTLLVNEDAFTDRNVEKAGYAGNPLDNGALKDKQVIPVGLTRLTREALSTHDLSMDQVDRSRNMFALGLSLWLYSRPLESVADWIEKKFAGKPTVAAANLHVLKKGYHFGETADLFVDRYEVGEADLPPGTYRTIRGAEALALGLITASAQSGLDALYASYPITPASDILHEISKHKSFGVRTLQAEDEIAAVTAAIGGAFGGALGITATSGPGMALKAEAIGLAVMAELPLVVVNMQRGGPSTGLPTKPEQADLFQALYGRNGEAPLAVLAASSPGDCYYTAYEACRIATKYMTPVILLADGYLSSGSEPWRIPTPADLPAFEVSRLADEQANDGAGFRPYVRHEATWARAWVTPGTKGFEHRIGGLEKEHETGNVSYDPANHQRMVDARAEKVRRIQQDIPPTSIHGDASGDLLVVGWGSTKGAIDTAVCRAQKQKRSVSSIHLRHLNPLPADLGEILARFERILVPELNTGHLLRVLRSEYSRPFIGLKKVQGQPFQVREIAAKFEEVLGESGSATVGAGERG